MLTLSGVLLAGGASRRMGRHKAFVEVGGESLAARALRVLDGVAADVVVASGDGERLAALGRPQVADAVPGGGPLAGIVAGLEAARADLVAVLAVDHPYASGPVLRRLAAAWSGEAAVVPVVAGRAQPLHAVWARSAAPALRQRLLAGRLEVVGAAEALGARFDGGELWADADREGRFARNVNAPDDLSPPPADRAR